MTSPQKLLDRWKELKPKLTELTYLFKKKELIKDALEVYLNQSSSFLSEHNNPIYQVEGSTEEMRRVYLNQKEKNKKIVEECKELFAQINFLN